jgi:hypothetical protein
VPKIDVYPTPLNRMLILLLACLHTVVSAFADLLAEQVLWQARTLHAGRRFGTQAWKESLLIRRDALRPPHRLGGVERVAPYSSRPHPSEILHSI